jgi:hemolysin activation/secretion protein
MKKQLSKAAITTLILLTPLECSAATALKDPVVNVPSSKETPVINNGEIINTQESKETPSFYLHKVELVDKGGLSFNEEKLLEIAQPYVKKTITLNNLNEMTKKMSLYLRNNGYPAAMVYVPEQEIIRSTIKIAILPGRYGNITLNNESKLDNDVAERISKKLHTGDIIKTISLETTIHNLNNLPGVKASTVLSPGTAKGTSDIVINIRDHKKHEGIAYVSNYGSKYSGRYQYAAQETINNISHKGDLLRIGTSISNKLMQNYYMSYEMNVGRSSSTIGIGLSHMNYDIDSYLASMGMEGKANTISVYGKTPIYKTSKKNLDVLYGYNYRSLQDSISSPNWDSDRHSHSGYIGLAGSVNQHQKSSFYYNLILTHGVMETDSADAELMDSVNHFSGGFTKGNADITAIQSLGHSTDILFRAQGQLASKNLDSSERFYLGGAQGVRAYPQGECSGDEGILGTAELRWYTPVSGLTLSCYLDGGEVRLRKSDNAHTSLLGWGVGLNYKTTDNWFARVDYARRIGGYDGMSEEAKAKGRLWFILGKTW